MPKLKDIELPNESGKVDPRLKKPGVRLREAGEGLRVIMDKFGKPKK